MSDSLAGSERERLKKYPSHNGAKTSPRIEETLSYLAWLLTHSSKEGEAMTIAREIGMEYLRFGFCSRHRDFTLARDIAARFAVNPEKSFAGYVFSRLSPEAKETWNRMQFWSDHKNWAEKRDAIFRNKSREIKQELYIHALVATCFDVSRACNMVGISYNQVAHWKDKDLHFVQLLEEIQFHKKNFFEQAMVDLVKARHPLAVIWSNKTLNADRGYSEKIRMEHTFTSDVMDIDSLDLDLDTRRKVLAAMRNRAAKIESGKGSEVRALPAPRDEVQEAEVVT